MLGGGGWVDVWMGGFVCLCVNVVFDGFGLFAFLLLLCFMRGLPTPYNCGTPDYQKRVDPDVRCADPLGNNMTSPA